MHSHAHLPKYVTIIRPKGTGLTEMENSKWDVTGPGRCEIMENGIETVKEHIISAARRMDLPIELREHQLWKNVSVPGYKARRRIAESDVLATVDPEERLLAFITACLRNNPTMTAMLGCTQAVDPYLDIIRTQNATVLEKEKGGSWEWKEIPRIYAISLESTHLSSVIERALRYCETN